MQRTFGFINSAEAANRSKKQAHFYLTQKQWKELMAALESLGYSSASEFFREKVREIIREATITKPATGLVQKSLRKIIRGEEM